MKPKPIAFDDCELRDWLIEVIEDGSENFRSALVEVAVTAGAEGYGVIRPASLEFRRKYSDRAQKRVANRRFITARGAV
jgi:hypothetical protein